MSASILATICAERLTKILVRYSRTPQTTVMRTETICPVRSVNPLPRSEATAAYLKPVTSDGQQVPTLGKPPAKWQPMVNLSSIGQRLQQECPLLRPKTDPMPQKFTGNTAGLANKSRGFNDWKQLGSTRYSTPFASIFQGPVKPFSRSSDSSVFQAHKLYRDCH